MGVHGMTTVTPQKISHCLQKIEEVEKLLEGLRGAEHVLAEVRTVLGSTLAGHASTGEQDGECQRDHCTTAALLPTGTRCSMHAAEQGCQLHTSTATHVADHEKDADAEALAK